MDHSSLETQPDHYLGFQEFLKYKEILDEGSQVHLWFVACETRHRRAGPVYRGSVAVCREFIWLKIVKRATGHIYTIDTMLKTDN